MEKLNIYICTFNCAREPVQPSVFGEYLLSALPDGLETPDMVVLCLQEIAPIAYSFLGGSFLSPYFGALRKAVKHAVRGTPFVNILARNVGMTAIMVFLRQELAAHVSEVQVGQVGVGVSEMGNKGAVGVRLFYQAQDGRPPIPITFVSCHLAPMEDAVLRRNEDYKNIVRRLVFAPDKPRNKVAQDEEDEDEPLLQGQVQKHGEATSGLYDGTSYLFLAGDLNYRTSDSFPSDADLKKFPQPARNTRDPQHYAQLLPKDQLTQQKREGKTLQGLIEAPVDFPPTYKYRNKAERPVQADDEQPWTWASHRWPSWCDRILFSDNVVDVHRYTCLPLFATSDHRPVAISLAVPTTLPPVNTNLAAVKPFEIDPEWQQRRRVARIKEVIIGLFAYLGLTWEGRGLLVATGVGAIGGWLIFRSILLG